MTTEEQRLLTVDRYARGRALHGGSVVKTTRKPDCCACGLCCVSLQDQDVFCDVTVEDLKRLPKSWARRNVASVSNPHWSALRTRWHKQQRGPLKGVLACQCCALRGNLLDRVECSIYKVRPAVCHSAMKPGERACLRLRGMYEKAVRDNDLEVLQWAND